MVESAYSQSRFRPVEIDHRYGPNVHLIDDPLAWTQLARLCARETGQPHVGRLVRTLYERLSEVAQESSNAWNNAGTGHAALCELNYMPEGPDGTLDPAKAIAINEQFQQSRQLWSSLVEKGVLDEPSRPPANDRP